MVKVTEWLSKIAEVYQEIVETDKQAGTNRAALLVESLAYAAYIDRKSVV